MTFLFSPFLKAEAPRPAEGSRITQGKSLRSRLERNASSRVRIGVSLTNTVDECHSRENT